MAREAMKPSRALSQQWQSTSSLNVPDAVPDRSRREREAVPSLVALPSHRQPERGRDRRPPLKGRPVPPSSPSSDGVRQHEEAQGGLLQKQTPLTPKPALKAPQWTVPLCHRSYSIEPCPRCGFPEADGGHCEECGWSLPLPSGLGGKPEAPVTPKSRAP